MPLEATPLSGVPVAILAQALRPLGTLGRSMEHWTLHPKDTDHFWHTRDMSITKALHQTNRQLVTLANTFAALCHWLQDVDEAVMKFTDDEIPARRLKAKQLIALEKCTDKLFLSTCDVDVEVSKFQAGVKAMKASLAMKKILAMKTIKVKGRNRKYQKFKLSKLAKMRTRSQRRQEMAADEENARQDEVAETSPNVGLVCVRCGSQRRQEMTTDEEHARQEEVAETGSYVGRVCVRCGCYEAFQMLTQECCWHQIKEHCRFRTADQPIPTNKAGLCLSLKGQD